MPFAREFDFRMSSKVKWTSLNACNRNTPNTIVVNPQIAPIVFFKPITSHSRNKMAEAMIVNVVNMTKYIGATIDVLNMSRALFK